MALESGLNGLNPNERRTCTIHTIIIMAIIPIHEYFFKYLKSLSRRTSSLTSFINESFKLNLKSPN